jgi:hypothetical protein
VYAPDGNRLRKRVMVGEATDEIVCAIVDFGSKNSIGFDTDGHPVLWPP